jgi:hypothetical protein
MAKLVKFAKFWFPILGTARIPVHGNSQLIRHVQFRVIFFTIIANGLVSIQLKTGVTIRLFSRTAVKRKSLPQPSTVVLFVHESISSNSFMVFRTCKYLKRINDQGLVVDAINLDDGHLMAINREGESWVARDGHQA